MKKPARHKRPKKAKTFDPAGWVLATVDRAFMSLYALARRNARRAVRLAVAFVPLMLLLVGSCKQATGVSMFDGIDRIRDALFPDRIIARDAHYRPAAGFVSRAQDFAQGDPAVLKNLTEQEIGFMYGAPALERHDADARVWQYKSGACVVDFYFYDDPAHKDESRVAYVDYRLKDDLIPGVLPHTGPVPESSQSRCLRAIPG